MSTPLERVRKAHAAIMSEKQAMLRPNDLALLLALADRFEAYIKADTLNERDAWWSNMRDALRALTATESA